MFRDYLYYAPHFTVYTDYNPLVYITSTTKSNASTIRWLNELSDFNFEVKYRPGRVNKEANLFSRFPLDFARYQEVCFIHCTEEEISAIMTGAANQNNDGEAWIPLNQSILTRDSQYEDTRVGELGASSQEESEDWMVGSGLEIKIVQSKFNGLQIDKLLLKQQADKDLRIIVECVNNQVLPTKEMQEQQTVEFRKLTRSLKELSVDASGLLKKGGRIVVPKDDRDCVIGLFHDDMGHLGVERVYDLTKRRFYWLGMYQDIKEYVQDKCDCKKAKKPSRNFRAPLQELTASAPFEWVSIDFLHLEKSNGGYEYILLIVDNFSRFCQAYATKNKSAVTAANCLFRDFMTHFGIPRKIHHDQESLKINSPIHWRRVMR